jgi:hypothetical protein
MGTAMDHLSHVRRMGASRMLLALAGLAVGGCGNSPPSLPLDSPSKGPRLHFLKTWHRTGYFLLENTSNTHLKLSGIKADDGTIYVEYGADYLCKNKNIDNQWMGMLEIRDYLSRSEFDVAPGGEQRIAYAYPSPPFHPTPHNPSEHWSDEDIRHDRCKMVLEMPDRSKITSPIFSMEGEDVVVWKAELLSPDKKYVATSEVVQLDDFDTEDIEASVFLKSVVEQHPNSLDKDLLKYISKVMTLRSPGPVPHPYEVDEANHGGPMKVELKWLTPSLLEISYHGNPQVHQITVGLDELRFKVRALDSAGAK